MVKKQKAFQFSSELMVFVLLCMVIVLCFLFLVPKVASTLFPWKRHMVLDNFLKQVQVNLAIPAQSFWEFREFYSPGYYTFDKNGVSPSQMSTTERSIGFSPKLQKGDNVFLTFTSSHLHSIEALVNEPSLQKIINSENNTNVLRTSSDNELLWRDGKGNWYIAFVKPISEMKTANGFFDYNNADKTLVEGKYWLDITEFDGK